MMTGSPLTYAGSLWNSSKYVSIGHARSGTGACLPAALNRLSTFSCAVSVTRARLAAARLAILSLPPIWSKAVLVLITLRMGFGGAGELMIEFMYGLLHPHLSGQCAPKHLFVAGEATTAFAS